MEQVKFLRGSRAAINNANIPDGAFCYATDIQELSIKMGDELVPLDNSVYWITNEDIMLSPVDINKRLAYNLDTETFYIAYRNKWYKASRDASIAAGTLLL